MRSLAPVLYDPVASTCLTTRTCQ